MSDVALHRKTFEIIDRKRSWMGDETVHSQAPAGELLSQMAAERIGFWRWAANGDDL